MPNDALKATRPTRKATTRVNMTALSEEMSEYLVWWAWAERSSISAHSAQLVNQAIKNSRSEIEGLMERAATRRQISVEQLKALVLANPRFDWTEE